MHDLPYDPDARRDTPLALKLKERIRRDGPIPLSVYMDACLNDPEHGYYVNKQAIGAKGDFVTAPEISQVFGELIGLWAVVVWQQMGSPEPFHLVEFGPGRGTLMADALRAIAKVPGVIERVEVHLVEQSATLKAIQQQTLASAGAPITWYSEYYGIPFEPRVIIGNEFLDVYPVDHWRLRPDFAPVPDAWPQDEAQNKLLFYTDDANVGPWQQRAVRIDQQDRLQFTWGPRATGWQDWFRRYFPRMMRSRFDAPPAPGEIIETRRRFDGGHLDFLWGIRSSGAAALLIDYGHTQSAVGETLQAVRNHVSEHPLTSPGEADITAQVDFQEVRGEFFPDIFNDPPTFDGPVTQAEFLGSLGIMERASRLMSANPQLANEIEMGVARLMAVPGMGDRFKAIGVRSPDLPPLPGF